MSGPQPRPAAERFWEKVSKTDTCWLWTAAQNGAGYGSFRIGSQTNGTRRQILAHRWSYQDAFGHIADDMVIDHLCRVPLCVRPSHLEPVAQRTNLLRGTGASAQHAKKTNCPQGHAYEVRIRNNKPVRWCRICHNEQRRKVPA